ncbi:MAG TPA: hypothetical protein VF188_12885 [Longimicrobiales bacterium]
MKKSALRLALTPCRPTRVMTAFLLVLGTAPALTAGRAQPPHPIPAGARICRAVDAARRTPERIVLEPTRQSLGFTGTAELTFAPSPFGVTVSPDGHHRYDVRIQLKTIRHEADVPLLIAWVATPDLSRRMKLGVVGADLTVSGRVDWNQFLVIVTAETSADVDRWHGPILLTGRSPSGRMHTMAGHGIFQSGYGFC